MTIGFDGMRKFGARLAVVAMVGLGASACSSIPDWVDPTTWIGGGGPSDNEQAAGESPDLASLPDRPAPSSTPDEQKKVADSLAADRAAAKYSSDALRGGTEPPAAPPPPASAVDLAQADKSTPPTPSPPPSDEQASNTPAPDSAPPAQESAPPAAPATASAELPPATPAAPAPVAAAEHSAAPVAAMAMVAPSDAALGFKPSTAPPLDPSIGQFVPPPIVARYDQTASAAGLSATRLASAAPPAANLKAGSRSRRAQAVGGPEAMSGAVVANLDVLQSPEVAQASVYANPQGLPPTSVIFFPGDGTLLSAEGRAQVRAAVETFKANGERGFMRIVGHASSRTSNMPLEKHLVVIFDKSQDRANAVAREAIREGVPANKVLVEAVGDSQPVFYESMPKGEDGNRRAEIFIQS